MNTHNVTPESEQAQKTQMDKMGTIKQMEEIIYLSHALD